MLCYPATSKVCKTPSADVQEALPTVPTQLLQNSNNKLTYKTYLHSPCNSAVKLDSKLLCHFAYFPLVLSVIEETKAITISKRKQDAIKWIGSKEITFLVWKISPQRVPACLDWWSQFENQAKSPYCKDYFSIIFSSGWGHTPEQSIKKFHNTKLCHLHHSTSFTLLDKTILY